MCGRFTQATPWAEVWAFSQPLSLTLPGEPLEPQYNIAPSQQAWVIASDGKGGGRAGRMRWGLVPHWAKDTKSGLSTFNARIETAATKPTFRSLFGKRHCLVPVSGYYEWVGRRLNKQPWYIHPAEAPLMFFAGLWDRWVSPSGEALLSFTVLTEPATGGIAALHDRRPVIVAPGSAPRWIDPTSVTGEGISSGHEIRLGWHQVGVGVGNVRSNGKALTEPIGP